MSNERTPADKRKATIERKKKAALKAAIAKHSSPQPMTRQYTNVGVPGFTHKRKRRQ
jgi:hypothetical protein